jgi:hypothetical protein
MFTALVAIAVSCAPLNRPPTTLRCEGADQVRRDHDGRELARWTNAPSCTRAVCEGSDFVRRTAYGAELDRWSFAPQCTSVRCEGADQVRRDSNGREVERWVNASSCPTRVDPAWQFGLTAHR